VYSMMFYTIMHTNFEIFIILRRNLYLLQIFFPFSLKNHSNFKYFQNIENLIDLKKTCDFFFEIKKIKQTCINSGKLSIENEKF